MSTEGRSVAYDGGQLFRVEHQIVPGRQRPYEFVKRIGATTVLPITEIGGEPYVVAIHNTRAYYGAREGLPCGNAEGGFDNPEHPTDTGLRELREETGYGYAAGAQPNVDTFTLRPVSNTILYDRSVSVVRGVQYLGGEDDNPREVIKVQPVPLNEYITPMFRLQREELYPEFNMALAKAAMEVGEDLVLDWLARGVDSPDAPAVVASFQPWMMPRV